MLYSLQPCSLLAPLSPLYGAVIRLRNYCYKQHIFSSYRSRLPVLCVGNITVGGTGKSPFVRFLAELLLSMGERPVILSRGYGGRIKEPHLVSENDSVETIGDEARMQFLSIGTKIPIVIAPKRKHGAMYIEQHDLGNIILLDDGFQHHALARDMNFLLLDVSTPASIKRWQQGCLLPGGWLREPLAQGIERAQAIIYISKSLNQTTFPEFSEHSSLPSFRFQFYPKEFRDVFDDRIVSVAELQMRKCSGLTAIANPESFFSLLQHLGIQLQDQTALPDHAFFKAADIDSVKFSPNSATLCTEKDAVKLKSLVSQAGKVYYLLLEGRFVSEKDERNFGELIATNLSKKKH